jgi:hypothetical protein
MEEKEREEERLTVPQLLRANPVPLRHGESRDMHVATAKILQMTDWGLRSLVGGWWGEIVGWSGWRSGCWIFPRVQSGLEMVRAPDTLIASNNLLTSLPVRAAHSLSSLKHLALIRNELRSLEGFEMLVNIEKLCVCPLHPSAPPPRTPPPHPSTHWLGAGIWTTTV